MTFLKLPFWRLDLQKSHREGMNFERLLGAAARERVEGGKQIK